MKTTIMVVLIGLFVSFFSCSYKKPKSEAKVKIDSLHNKQIYDSLAEDSATHTGDGKDMSQYDINMEAGDAYSKVDKELNDIYQKILSKYKSDTVFIKNLKKSQNIWIKFRDAELRVEFPERQSVAYYGSNQSTCESNFLKQLTIERIERLKEILNIGINNGDC